MVYTKENKSYRKGEQEEIIWRTTKRCLRTIIQGYFSSQEIIIQYLTLVVKNLPANAGDVRDPGGGGENPGRKKHFNKSQG